MKKILGLGLVLLGVMPNVVLAKDEVYMFDGNVVSDNSIKCIANVPISTSDNNTKTVEFMPTKGSVIKGISVYLDNNEFSYEAGTIENEGVTYVCTLIREGDVTEVSGSGIEKITEEKDSSMLVIKDTRVNIHDKFSLDRKVKTENLLPGTIIKTVKRLRDVPDIYYVEVNGTSGYLKTNTDFVANYTNEAKLTEARQFYDINDEKVIVLEGETISFYKTNAGTIDEVEYVYYDGHYGLANLTEVEEVATEPADIEKPKKVTKEKKEVNKIANIIKVSIVGCIGIAILSSLFLVINNRKK